MKKFLMIAALVGIVLANCSKDKDSEPQITITGLKMTDGYKIWIAGSGTASIDWGDGSAVQTLTLTPLTSVGAIYNEVYKVAPPYTDFTNLYNLTITGNLTGFTVDNFTITALNLNMPTLEVLWCQNNNLATLDVSKCIALKELGCYTNKLTTLTLGTHAGLYRLNCSNNRLNKASLVQLFNKLPMRAPADNAKIICGGNNATSANPGYAELTADDKKIAEDKNWSIANWE